MRDRHGALNTEQDRCTDALVIELPTDPCDGAAHEQRGKRSEREPAELGSEEIGDRRGHPLHELDRHCP